MVGSCTSGRVIAGTVTAGTVIPGTVTVGNVTSGVVRSGTGTVDTAVGVGGSTTGELRAG